MAETLFEKLVLEIQRFQNKSFLKAAMAVCALVAQANAGLSLSKRYRVDAVLKQLGELAIYDPHKAIEIFDDYVFRLQESPGTARAVLYGKLRRFAGSGKQVRTLMRVAYAILTCDGEPSAAERREFERICTELDVNPAAAMADLSQRVAPA